VTVATEIAERRRLAIVDGDRRHEVVAPVGATLSDALHALGIRARPGRDVLIERAGREVSPLLGLDEVDDGAVFALVDLAERAPARRRRAPDASRAAVSGTRWVLGGVGALLALAVLAFPDALDAASRPPLATALAVGAVGAGVVVAARSAASAGVDVVAVLVLAFAAGAVAVPPVPAASLSLAVTVGLLASALLASALGVVGHRTVLRAHLGGATVMLLTLAAVWGGSLLLSLPPTAPAAVTVGLTPVALRMLLASLVDVSPGTFVDYEQFQSMRWTVRQQLPAPVHTVQADDAKSLVARSTARLTAGTLTLCAAAASAALLAVPDFGGEDPLVLAGRIALVVCVVLALLLGARRATRPLLRWMPRLTAAAVALAAASVLARDAGTVAVPIIAAGCLVAGAAAALLVIPVGRGVSSLSLSRVGDVFEALAVALSLPAALLAADAVDVLRGMMGA
jgi:hypothetical protein